MCKSLILGFMLVMSMACSLGIGNAWAQPELKIITLQHRFAQDLLPAVQPLVGTDGTASAVENHLMIRTTPERMQAIEQVVATMDTERKNVRITVSHADTSNTQGSRAGVSGNVRSGDVEIRTSRSAPDGIRADIDRNQSSSSQSGTEFVTVLDGERAFIRVGKSVPYTQQWMQLTRRYMGMQQTTVFQDITTGFAVRPRYIGDQVELEITPRIASVGHGNIVDFEELSTVVRVTPGQWFDLGGNMQSRDDVSRTILSRQQGSGSRNGNLSIKVD
jgi:type II secretory pathway component GspD/PulD (secretin)